MIVTPSFCSNNQCPAKGGELTLWMKGEPVNEADAAAAKSWTPVATKPPDSRPRTEPLYSAKSRVCIFSNLIIKQVRFNYEF